MPFTSDVDLFCVEDPRPANARGKALDAPPDQGGFTLIGAGGTIDDDLAERFGLQGDSRLKPFDEVAHRQAIEDRNRATYDQNEGVTRAHQGLGGPTVTVTGGTSPAPAMAPAEAAPTTDGSDTGPRRGRPPTATAEPDVIR